MGHERRSEVANSGREFVDALGEMIQQAGQHKPVDLGLGCGDEVIALVVSLLLQALRPDPGLFLARPSSATIPVITSTRRSPCYWLEHGICHRSSSTDPLMPSCIAGAERGAVGASRRYNGPNISTTITTITRRVVAKAMMTIPLPAGRRLRGEAIGLQIDGITRGGRLSLSVLSKI